MTDRSVLTPDTRHPITVERNANRVVVRAGDAVIADTREALTLREAGYPAVHYIPRKDVDFSALRRSGLSTYCPYKGDAAYYDLLPLGVEKGENAVWTYEQPFEAVAEIVEHLAFYPDRVAIAEE